VFRGLTFGFDFTLPMRRLPRCFIFVRGCDGEKIRLGCSERKSFFQQGNTSDRADFCNDFKGLRSERDEDEACSTKVVEMTLPFYKTEILSQHAFVENNFLFGMKFSDKNDEKKQARFKSFNSSENKRMKEKLLLLSSAILAFYFLASFASAEITSGIGVHVIVGVPNSAQKCSGNINSCGAWPNCLNLANISYCVNGKIYESYCLSNSPRNRSTSNTCTEFGLNLTDDDGNENSADFYIYSAGTANVLGSGSISGLDRMIFTPSVSKTDFELRYDDSRMMFLLKNLDITKLNGNLKIIIHKKDIDPDISGINVLRSYHVELPSQFSYSSLILKLKYDSSEVDNENALVVYRCGSFSSNTNSCNVNWIIMPNITIDKNNNIVSLTLSSFSVYMLAEQGGNTTTTTTVPSNTTTTSTATTSTTTTSSTTTTIISSGSDGGSSGSSGTTTTVQESTTVLSTIEEQSDTIDANTTSTDVTQLQSTNPTTGFASLIEQNKLIIASPFIALVAAGVLYYSFQKNGQSYSKFHGGSKIYKKLRAKSLNKKNMRKRGAQHTGTVLRL